MRVSHMVRHCLFFCSNAFFGGPACWAACWASELGIYSTTDAKDASGRA